MHSNFLLERVTVWVLGEPPRDWRGRFRCGFTRPLVTQAILKQTTIWLADLQRDELGLSYVLSEEQEEALTLLTGYSRKSGAHFEVQPT